MGKLLVLFFFFLLCMLFHVNHCASNFSSFPPRLSPKTCPPDESFALLQFKYSFSIDSRASWLCVDRAYPKTNSWEEGTDCCSWDGVACDVLTGHVIGLDLSCSWLNGSIRSNSSLFNLSHLQSVNLAFNNFFHHSPIPSELGFLVKLTHLNLSTSEFLGEIPHEISYLSKLVSLDLGRNDLQVDNYAFQKLIHNLTELRVLDLSWSNMSLVEPKSLLNISSSLRSLSLSDCSLNGDLLDDFSCFSLLEELDLSANYDITGNFRNVNKSTPLRSLDISGTHLSGTLPDSIDSLKSLEHLDLSHCSLTGSIPPSVANLEQLKYLDLSGNKFGGQIPDVFGNLTKLSTLYLGRNNFVGTLPLSVFNLTQLTFIDLSYNQIDGPFPNNVSGLSYLTDLGFSFNQLNGKIPSWLFTIPSLSYLELSNNKFTGCFPIHPFQQPNSVTYVDLSNNEIHGPIQNPIFELVSLQSLDLSSNNLSDVDIEWNMLQKLTNLLQLLLSHNSNITKFPNFLETLENLTDLYLDNNRIHGMIPKKKLQGWKKLEYLNLSGNSLTGLEQHPWNNIVVLDLSSNLIQGPLPVPPRGTTVFMISKNKLSGQIPSFICSCISLTFLDLSDNRLNGEIPQCLGNFSSLQFLNLQNNNFHGSIPDAFANGSKLWYVNLSGNQFERQIPRSLINCSSLQILDLGNNKINDTFPYWLGTLLQLKVLILRSNNFHGVISLPKKTGFELEQLQILHLSDNQFNGNLPITLFGNLKSMMNMGRDHNSEPRYLGDDMHDYPIREDNNGGTYVEIYRIGMVKVTMKGWEFDMPKILVTFKLIDFSNNRFEGEIPEVFCKFKSLKVLNFSHNNLGGHIPSSFGNLTELESLDLSSNKLVGQIPQQLAVLTSLEVLNLSYNLLEGPIPEGSQLSTFPNDSYIGNVGLCGFPLSKKCHGESSLPPPSESPHKEDDSTNWFDWKIVMMGYGSGIVIGLSTGYIVFTTGKPWWFVKMVEKKQDKIVRRINRRHRGERKLGIPRGRQ